MTTICIYCKCRIEGEGTKAQPVGPPLPEYHRITASHGICWPCFRRVHPESEVRREVQRESRS